MDVPPPPGTCEPPQAARPPIPGRCGRNPLSRMLIKGWLPRSGVALISGQSRVGKTFLAIDLAGAIATKGTFFGRPAREQTGVLFILGEGASTMEPRLEALRLTKFGELDAAKLPIGWVEVSRPKALGQEIEEAAAEILARFGVRLGLVVIDTLAAVFNVPDENDPKSGHRHYAEPPKARGRQRLPSCWRKPLRKNAEAGVRGSSAWTASADVVLAATATISEATGVVKDRKLALTKSRFAETCLIGGFDLEAVVIGVDEDSEPLTSATIRRCDAPARRKKPSPAHTAVDGVR